MPDNGSVTHWIQRLKEGDRDAARILWERYCGRLIALARQKLGGSRRAADEEDVVQNAFASFYRRAEKGQFPQLDDRDDLLSLLLKITVNKAIKQAQWQRRLKRGGGQVRGDSALMNPTAADSDGGWDDVIGTEPTPEHAARMVEDYQRLMVLLPDDEARSIVQLKLEGHTNDEIASHLGCSPPTVERRLSRVIRPAWRAELDLGRGGDVPPAP